MTVEAVEREANTELVVIMGGQRVEQLREAITAVALAVSTDKQAPDMLTSIRLEIEDGNLVLVGTDRFRLHVARIPVEGDGVTDANLTPVSVNAKDLAAWARSARGACTLTIRRTEQHVELETNLNLIRLIANHETYANWRSLISGAKEYESESVNELAVNGKYAYDMSKAYALATNNKTPWLHLKITTATRPMLTHVEGSRFTFTGLLMPIRLPA